jgi:hypothetical protein
MPQPQEKSSTPSSKPQSDNQHASPDQDSFDAAMASLSPEKRDKMLDELVALAKSKRAKGKK